MATPLEIAQQKLMQLRGELGITADLNVTKKDTAVTEAVQPSNMPSHLGWHSSVVTEQLRRHAQHKIVSQTIHTDPFIHTEEANRQLSIRPVKTAVELTDQIIICPALGNAFLRNEVSATARIWLLLRQMDTQGRGVISISQAREQLTKLKKVCGWRHLRNLLRNGNDLFWTRDKQMIWLASPARVGAKLGVHKFEGRMVALSAETLRRSLTDVKAHLYEAFHAGRKDAPIARDTISAVCGVSENTQRAYERRAKIIPTAQFSIEATYSEENWEEAAWKHGTKTFSFNDKKGFHGRAGTQYIATQLPNRYDVELTSKRSCHNRRWNKKLADLLNQGTVGNGRTTYSMRYCENAVLASKKRECGLYKSTTPAFWYPLG